MVLGAFYSLSLMRLSVLWSFLNSPVESSWFFFEILEGISELKLCLIRFLLENIISFGKLNELKMYFHLFN